MTRRRLAALVVLLLWTGESTAPPSQNRYVPDEDAEANYGFLFLTYEAST